MSSVSMRQMLEAGVHFGHQTRFWNPKMAQYHLRRAQQDPHHQPREDAAAVRGGGGLRQAASSPMAARVLFVGTKRSAREAIAARSGALRHALREPALAGRHAHQLQDHPPVDQAPGRARRADRQRRLDKRGKKEAQHAAPRDGEAREEPGRHQGHGGPAGRAVRHRRRPREASRSTRRRSSASRWSRSSTPTARRTASTTSIPGNDDAMRAIQLYAAGMADAVLEGKLGGAARGGRRRRVRRAGRGGQAARRRARPRRRAAAPAASSRRCAASLRRRAEPAVDAAAELAEADPEESRRGRHGRAARPPAKAPAAPDAARRRRRAGRGRGCAAPRRQSDA